MGSAAGGELPDGRLRVATDTVDALAAEEEAAAAEQRGSGRRRR